MYQANQRTVEMASFGIEGNVIDHSWFHIIKNEKGKTDSNAIIILSDLVYWYRPIYRTDPETGEQKIYKKFKEDILQRSYKEIEKTFGFTKDQARDALITLESLGVAEREMRTVDMGGTPVSNILFIRFKHEKLLLLMKEHYEKAANLKKVISSSEISDKGIGNFPQAPRKFPSNTDTSPQTSPETSSIKGDGDDSKFSKDEWIEICKKYTKEQIKEAEKITKESCTSQKGASQKKYFRKVLESFKVESHSGTNIEINRQAAFDFKAEKGWRELFIKETYVEAKGFTGKDINLNVQPSDFLFSLNNLYDSLKRRDEMPLEY